MRPTATTRAAMDEARAMARGNGPWFDDALRYIERCQAAVNRLVRLGVLEPQTDTEMAHFVAYLKFARAHPTGEIYLRIFAIGSMLWVSARHMGQ